MPLLPHLCPPSVPEVGVCGAYEGHVIQVDLLHLMSRRHVQHGSPQDPNMLKTLTNNYLGHPGDAWCNLQHQAHQSARNQRWQNFSNRLSSWDMRPQYLDSARQNASIYLISLCSNSTICRSTQGKTCELVSPTRERSRLRPKNPETPKSSASALKNMVTYPPPTHTFLKRPFLTDFKKHTHTPPKVTTFWCIGLKVEKNREKCEFAPCWHVLNVPERYLALVSVKIFGHLRQPPAEA